MREGLIVGQPGPDPCPERMRFMPGSHPLPDERSEAAGRAALDLAARTGRGRLLVAAFSGGGSAMACVPASGIRLEDKVGVTAALLARGAAIGEMNAVRKHLSALKGGRLAQAAFPARVVNLLLSDVAGDDPGTIASGPGYPDSTTFSRAAEILSRYGIGKVEFPAVLAHIEEGVAGLIPETPKPGDRVFAGVQTFVIGRNADALEAARRTAVGLSFDPMVRSDPETGEARAAARRSVAFLEDAAAGRPVGSRPICTISGGEYTVRVKGKGRGGRNQEFVLASLLELGPILDAGGFIGGRDWLVLSLGTDGIDGPTDAAGAWAGPEIWRRVRSLGLNPLSFLEDNDSYSFFQAAGGLLLTGPTGTNVMDLRLALLA
jgi:glycerate-2-kinase